METTSLTREYCRRRLPMAHTVAIASLVVGLQVGTGGASTVEYVKSKGSMGYAFANYDQAVPSSDWTSNVTAVRSPAEDLAHIRNVFRPSITDLANALGVSRQAVYDWQAGKPIAADNAARLSDLGRAADLFAREGLTATAQLLRRPITSGKNLFQLVRDGGSAEEATHALIDIVKREALQRERLQARLAGRPPLSREAYADIGTPIVREDS